MRVLGLVPARAGSKGIPSKNLRALGGRPLLEYTARAALASSRLTRVILTTDDETIAAVGRRLGLEVPFMRPSEMAADETPMVDVVRHAIDWLEGRGETFEAVCVLQPTSPFRRSRDIDDCIDLLERLGADAVVSILPVPPEYNPHWTYFLSGDGFLRLSTGETAPITRRQDLPAAYHRDGAVYVTRCGIIRSDGSLFGRRVAGHLGDPTRYVNLNEPDDWLRAEEMLRTGGA